MLDIAYVRENLDDVRTRLQARGFDTAVLDRFADLDKRRRAAITEHSEISAERNRLSPEIGALNMGTMNYSKYSKTKKEFVFDMVFPNTYAKILKVLEAMNRAGVKPELECFDSRHTAGVAPLLDMGALKFPYQFSFIVNVLGGIPPMIESLQLQTKIMPPGSDWEVIGISHGHWRMLASALVLGGNIRTGLQDHLYLPNGTMARNNGEMVEVAARMTRDVGREPATVEEARELLHLYDLSAGRDAAKEVGHAPRAKG